MSNHEQSSPANLDPRLTSLLGGLRSRIRRFVVWDSALTILGVLMAAFWLGFALDYLPVVLGGTEMPRLARLILLLAAVATMLFLAWRMLIGRLQRPLPDDSLALLVERHHPALGGRLVTAVQLNRPHREGDSHSPELLRQVHNQAAEKIDQVDPARVFRLAPLVKKAFIAVPMVLMAVVMLAVSPQAFGRAASRLTLLSDEPWPRRAHLEMVGVELPVVSVDENDTSPPKLIPFVDKVIRLPRGSHGALRIRAKADGGAELPVVCTVHYETTPSLESGSDSGLEESMSVDRSVRSNVQGNVQSNVQGFESSGQSNMRRVGRVTDGYQAFLLDGPPLASLSDSVLLSVRGLDDRLDNYRIEAVMPPVITQMQVGVRYPNYLRPGDETEAAATGREQNSNDDFDRLTPYQAGLRLAEGSGVTLMAQSSVPLGESQVLVRTITDEEVPVSVDYSDDRRSLQLRIENFSSPTTVAIVPADASGISAQAPYRYLLGVVLDEPPELKMKLVGIGTAVTASARIPIEAEVSDDYGIEQLNLLVTPSFAEKKSSGQKGDAAEGGIDGADPAASSFTTSKQPTVDRDGKANSEMDLRDLIAAGSLPELVSGNAGNGDAINIIGEVTDRYNLSGRHLTRSEVFRLQIVTPEKLLSLMERRELALRSRLEQTIDETRSLRDALSLLQRGLETESEVGTEGEEDTKQGDQTRVVQVRRLRVQQSGLQAGKTSEELSGIAASLDDILLEMVNNRVDSVDRQKRIGTGVRDPLRQIVDKPLSQLRQQITELERVIEDQGIAAGTAADAVQTSEEVLLQLTAVLEKMLDLESYNEILDLVRGLIDDQDKLIDETKKERKKGVLDLFE